MSFKRPKRGHRLSPVGLKAREYVADTLRPLGDLPDEHWVALHDILNFLDRMYRGNAPKRIALSSADPGLGKTTCLRSYCRALLESDTSTGMLVAISNYREIEDFVSSFPKELHSRISVWTAVDLTSTQGVQQHNKERPSAAIEGRLVGYELAQDTNKAQLLITTHEKVRRILAKEGDFKDAGSLYYDYRPRQVKAWDEQIAVCQSVAIQVSELFQSCAILSTLKPGAYRKLAPLFCQMEEREGTFRFPDLDPYGIDKDWLYELVEGSRSRPLHESTIDALTVLTLISGQAVWLRSNHQDRRKVDDEVWDTALLTFSDTTMTSLSPVLVLDASGRVRDYYKDLEARGILKFLESAIKDYSNLQIYHKAESSGKASLRPGSTALHRKAKDIAKLIAGYPDDETWLICSHPENLTGRNPVQAIGPLIQEQLQLLGVDHKDRVYFTTWGQHTSTNKFSHVKNLVAASVLTLPDTKYEADKRSSSNHRPEDGALHSSSIRKFRKSEHQHDLLQFACRGHMRLPGATVRPSRFFFMASNRSGVKGVVRKCFPGTPTIKPWPAVGTPGRPVELPSLSGKALEAFNVLVELFRTKDTVKFNEVRLAVGIKDAPNFKKIVRHRTEFQGHLAKLGIVEEQGKQRAHCWVMIDRKLFEQNAPKQKVEEFF